MNNHLIIKGLQVYTEDEVLPKMGVAIADGVITEIGAITESTQSEIIEFPENWHLIPGMIDLHIHGVAGADTMDATAEALQTVSMALVREGVTSFLPTTVTAPIDEIEQALMNVRAVVEQQSCSGATILGINLEGPFLATNKAGVQMTSEMLLPNSELFAKWQHLSGDLIKMVTVAPELDGASKFIKYLVDHGVIASLGHSDADYEQAQEAIAAGVTEATHLFNAMHRVHHRDPGNAIALLLSDKVIVEIIADGLHLHTAMLQLVLRVKGADHIVMITDAMRAKQLGCGEYDFGGKRVVVKDGAAQLVDGTFAGSVLTMDQALRNMLQYTDCTLMDICKMAAANPAKQLNMFQRKGSIAIGKDADLVVLNEDYHVMLTIGLGRILYRNKAINAREIL